MSTESEKIKKLFACCNDLGKAFKNMKIESDKREENFVNQIGNLEKKISDLNTKVEKQDSYIKTKITDCLDVHKKNSDMKKEFQALKDLKERITKFELTQQNGIDDDELELVKDEILAVNSKIESVDEKLTKFELTQQNGIDDDELELVKDDIMAVNSKIESIDDKLTNLDEEYKNILILWLIMTTVRQHFKVFLN